MSGPSKSEVITFITVPLVFLVAIVALIFGIRMENEKELRDKPNLVAFKQNKERFKTMNVEPFRRIPDLAPNLDAKLNKESKAVILHWESSERISNFEEISDPTKRKFVSVDSLGGKDFDRFVPRTPSEINTVIYWLERGKVIYTYTNGGHGIQPIITVYIYDVPSNTVLAKSSFAGGMPSEKITTGGHPAGRWGSAIGSVPNAAIYKWIDEQFSAIAR